MQLDTKIRSQKSMWKNWEILYAINTGNTSRNRHMLRPQKCLHRHLEARKQRQKSETHSRNDATQRVSNFPPQPHWRLSCCYLLRDAPRARIIGSVISIIDCKVEVTTMKRMMLRRKVRCSACMSNRPVWRASRSRVTPSVTPLTTKSVH